MAFVQYALGWIAGLPTVPVYVVTAAVLAAETGLLIGVLLPAEPLLLLVGYLVSTGRLGLVTALLVTTAAALTGDWLAYLFGRRLGLHGGRFVRHDRWARARTLFARHGGFAVAAGRWTAFVRTLTPRMAGAARLHPARFLIWDLVAVLIWVPGSVLARRPGRRVVREAGRSHLRRDPGRVRRTGPGHRDHPRHAAQVPRPRPCRRIAKKSWRRCERQSGGMQATIRALGHANSSDEKRTPGSFT